jgi:uncharacterized protein YjbI with pentapeptide repeats
MATAASKNDLIARWKGTAGERLQQAALQALRGKDREALLAVSRELDLRGIALSGEIFGVDLSGVDFTYASVPKGAPDPFILFKKCVLTDAVLREIRSELAIEVCVAHGADFTGSNLRKNDFVRCQLRGARFDRANLRSANFYGLDLQDCSFVGADLRNAMLNRADCSGADFTDANLENAMLEDIIVSAKTRLPKDERTDAGQPLTADGVSALSREIVQTALDEIGRGTESRELESFLRDVLRQFQHGGRPDVFASIDETFREPQRTRLLELLSRAARVM